MGLPNNIHSLTAEVRDMVQIHKLNEDISWFQVPYKDIFVAIYVIRTETGTVLFDTAACDGDVENYILPVLRELQLTPSHIFISHNHLDHAGGLSAAAALWPEAVILSRNEALLETYPQAVCPEDGQRILDVLQVVAIPGHTKDSAALLDLRTNTLITGDCLQSYGIYGSGNWYGAVVLPAEHLAAVRKLRTLPLAVVATAHDYHPVGVVSCGADAINARLDSCVGALERLRGILEANPMLRDAQLVQLCNDGKLPLVAEKVITALRGAIKAGTL